MVSKVFRSAIIRVSFQLASIKAEQILQHQHNMKQMHFYADGGCFMFM